MQMLHRCAGIMLALAACAPAEEDDVSIVPPLARVTRSGFAPAVEPPRWEVRPREEIVKNSATDFEVKRSVIERLIEQQAELMRCMRIVPQQADGHVAGIRVFVRPDSVIARLGIESGDRIEAINGFDITAPEKALEAYARLRSADMLTVQLRRDGVKMEIDYRIW